jgi:hypothetical protein
MSEANKGFLFEHPPQLRDHGIISPPRQAKSLSDFSEGLLFLSTLRQKICE